MVNAVAVFSAALVYYVLIFRGYGETATTQAPQKVSKWNTHDALVMAKQTELEAQKAKLKAKQAGLHAQKARLKAQQTGQMAQAAADGPQPAASKASVSTTQSQSQTPGQTDAGKSMPVHPAHVVAEHAKIEAQQANVKAQEAMAEAQEARIQAQKAALQAQGAAQAHKSEEQAQKASEASQQASLEASKAREEAHEASVKADQADAAAQQALQAQLQQAKAQEKALEDLKARIRVQGAKLDAQELQRNDADSQATIHSLWSEFQTQRTELNQLKAKTAFRRQQMDMVRRQLERQQAKIIAQQTRLNYDGFRLKIHEKWINGSTWKLRRLTKKLPTILMSVSIPRDKNRTRAVFHASSNSTSDWSAGNNRKVILPLVSVNKGHAYNNVEGVFTAPCAGAYFFTATGHAPFSYRANLKSVFITRHLRIVTLDDNSVVKTLAETSMQYRSEGTCNTVVQLRQGQKVWLTTATSTRFAGGYFSAFSGFLVKADV